MKNSKTLFKIIYRHRNKDIRQLLFVNHEIEESIKT